jgi:hypothetical protein
MDLLLDVEWDFFDLLFDRRVLDQDFLAVVLDLLNDRLVDFRAPLLALEPLDTLLGL